MHQTSVDLTAWLNGSDESSLSYQLIDGGRALIRTTDACRVLRYREGAAKAQALDLDASGPGSQGCGRLVQWPDN